MRWVRESRFELRALSVRLLTKRFFQISTPAPNFERKSIKIVSRNIASHHSDSESGCEVDELRIVDDRDDLDIQTSTFPTVYAFVAEVVSKQRTPSVRWIDESRLAETRSLSMQI